jgi:superfamily II DNA or RNA helicase
MRLVQRDPSTAYIDNWLWVPKRFTNAEGVKNALSFAFSDTYSEHKSRYVYLWKETNDHLLVPRHFWDVKNLPYRVVDLRPQSYPKVDITSNIKLDHRWREDGRGSSSLVPTGDDVQHKSLDALLQNPEGTLQLACGKGKTCVALELAARMRVPVLIVLPDTQLLEQWSNEIAALLNVPDGVGLIQGAKNDWRKPVVLTTYHTLGARAPTLPEEVLRWFGLIIWDEGHHVPAPTFAASAEVFYGKRISLTATPNRDDGLHIISMYHIGPVVYKDLKPVQKPRIFFKWTGLTIDETRAGASIRDRNGEVHGSKVNSYFAKWAERRTDLLNDAAYAVQCGRKVLVLSNSEAEIANMAAMWSSGHIGLQPTVPLYTDIPTPTPMDVGEFLMPVALDDAEYNKVVGLVVKLRAKAAKAPNMNPTFVNLYNAWNTELNKRPADVNKIEELGGQLHEYTLTSLMQNLAVPEPQAEVVRHLFAKEQELLQHEIHRKIEAELDKRQKLYIKDLNSKLVNCGIMLHKVSPKERKRYIDTMPIVFAIMKYGKEGLDSEELDTILISSVFSSRNGLQQVMGRPTRDHKGKKSPVIVLYEDNVGHIIGMCKKLKKHLREWSHEEGGPYEYEYIGHPTTTARTGTWIHNLSKIFSR